MEPMEKWKHYLDAAGRVTVWPAKRDARAGVLRYLGAGLEFGRYYTEKEINVYLDTRHTFGDHFLLRREMVDAGILCRVADGSRYWRGDPLTGQTSKQADTV